jgi:hypothetical protein
MDDRPVAEHHHGVARLTVPAPIVAAFQTRFEAAVPEPPGAAPQKLVARGVSWS